MTTVKPAKRKGSTGKPTAKILGELPRAGAQSVEKAEVKISVSYSHADDPSRLKLEKHLAPLKREGVATWFDGDLHAGQELDPEIAKALRRAHLFIALISPDYLSSAYCWNKEYLRAMRRRARRLVHVVGIVLKPCDWKNTKAARFKQLPKDARAVSDWRSADHAFLDVTKGIRDVVKVIPKETVAEIPKPVRARSTIRKAPPRSGPKTAVQKPKAGAKSAKSNSERLGSQKHPSRRPVRAAKLTNGKPVARARRLDGATKKPSGTRKRPPL